MFLQVTRQEVLAKARGMKVETIDLKNSGDTAGTKDRVVGYGAWAFYDPTTRRKTVPLNITINKKQPDNAPDSPTDFEKQTKQLLAMHGPHRRGPGLQERVVRAVQYRLRLLQRVDFAGACCGGLYLLTPARGAPRPCTGQPSFVLAVLSPGRRLTDALRQPARIGSTQPTREIGSTGPRPGDAHPFRRSGQLAPVAGDAPGASTPPRRREPGR